MTFLFLDHSEPQAYRRSSGTLKIPDLEFRKDRPLTEHGQVYCRCGFEGGQGFEEPGPEQSAVEREIPRLWQDWGEEVLDMQPSRPIECLK